MIRFWLQFHPLAILAGLLVLFLFTGALIHWIQQRSPLSARLREGALGLPTFVAVSTLFALFAAFLLADTMARKERASQAVQTESAAILGLAIASEAANASGTAIRTAILAYADSVVTDEWPQLLRETGSASTEQALLALLRAVRDAADIEGLAPSVHGQMLSLAQAIVDARTDRIAIVANHYQQFSWSALFLLGFLTQFVMGMGFMDRAPANRYAIRIFSLAAVIALWLLAIQDNPFRGPTQVSPKAIEQAVSAWRT
jgi:hypothetical protein